MFTKALSATDDNWKEIKRIADFFGYSMNRSGSIVDFEPIQPEHGSSYIDNECKGIVYHICPKGKVNKKTGKIDNEIIAKSIVKNGLRTKNGSSEKDPVTGKKEEPYRYFPERIYVLAFKPGTDIKKELQKVAPKVAGVPWEDTAVFKVGVRTLPYTFYKDTAMSDNPHAFFTYNNIPPGLITRIH